MEIDNGEPLDSTFRFSDENPSSGIYLTRARSADRCPVASPETGSAS